MGGLLSGMGLGQMVPLGQLAMTWVLANATKEQQDRYQNAVDQQIKEGKAGYQARTDAWTKLVNEDPTFKQANALFQSQYAGLPASMKQGYKDLEVLSNKERGQFLQNYDANTGKYLNAVDQAQAGLMSGLQGQTQGLSADYAKREADVMELLQGQGEQALKDTQRSFGEQTGAALGDLAARGLSGSGVGASIRGGLATRESDQLARIREQVAAQKASALSGLRGDTLGFGERAMQLGAGFQNEGIGRYLGANQTVQSVRAGFDSAMRGDTQAQRERALQGVYGANLTTGGNLANYLQGWGQLKSNVYGQATGDQMQFLSGGPIQYMPPDWSFLGPMSQSAGAGLTVGNDYAGSIFQR